MWRLKMPPFNIPEDRFEIVGIVQDALHELHNGEARSEMYIPYSITGLSNMLVVHTSGDPMRMAPYVRTQVYQLDGSQFVDEANSLERLLDRYVYSRGRFQVWLMGSFASLRLAARRDRRLWTACAVCFPAATGVWSPDGRGRNLRRHYAACARSRDAIDAHRLDNRDRHYAALVETLWCSARCHRPAESRLSSWGLPGAVCDRSRGLLCTGPPRRPYGSCASITAIGNVKLYV